jgi:hypothetical protein
MALARMSGSVQRSKAAESRFRQEVPGFSPPRLCKHLRPVLQLPRESLDSASGRFGIGLAYVVVELDKQQELKADSPHLDPGSLRSEADSLKTTVCVLFFLCFAAAAFGQASVGGAGLSAEPVVYEFQSHTGRASQQEMGTHQDIMEQSTNVVAHGVRPLWEFATPAMVVPLGDSARVLRKEHLAAKKADIVWNN